MYGLYILRTIASLSFFHDVSFLFKMLLGKRAIVLGGAGQLGQSVISKFVRNGWKTISVDYLVNEESSGSIEIPEGKPQYF